MRIRWLWLSAAIGAVTLLSTTRGTAAGESVRGQNVYTRYCATCHGERGDGRGPNAFRLQGPQPRDFTRGAYKFRTTPGGSVPRHADIVRTVAEGLPGTTMLGWKTVLTAADIDAVATYLESFSPRFAETPDASRQTVRIPPAPAGRPSPQEVEAGRMLYVAFKCWECHGMQGAADGPASRTLKDDKNQPILPANLSRGIYLSGDRPEDLYRTIATGLAGGEPGSAIPSNPMPTFGLAVVVGREGISDLGTYQSKLDPSVRTKVSSFIAALPSQDAIDALTDDQRASLGERRIWLLVDYVRSLARPRSALSYLLFDDPRQP
jgi:cytochrome c oxidase cbb3-type subunit 2